MKKFLLGAVALVAVNAFWFGVAGAVRSTPEALYGPVIISGVLGVMYLVEKDAEEPNAAALILGVILAAVLMDRYLDSPWPFLMVVTGILEVLWLTRLKAA